MQPRFPENPSVWRQEIEQRLQQLHVDVQRLWKRSPQIPDPEAGLPDDRLFQLSDFAGAPSSGGGGLTFYLGKTDAQLLKGNTGTISRYTNHTTDSGVNDTSVRNLFDDIDSGRWVWYVVDYNSNKYIIRAEY